ncbi:MAG: N-acetyltransferase [Bacteroidetes bacterium]|nr:N-acetyltransferase [Bacteroidota bacterium]
MVRKAKKSDAENICAIYNYYVSNTVITFEEEEISTEEMESRIISISAGYRWLVYEEDGGIKGFAYFTKWKDRNAYRYTSEVTVYTDKDHTGKGIGKILLNGIISSAAEKKIHLLIGVIALPNEPSINLFERSGFKRSAYFSEAGFKFGKWIDVGYWSRPLD